MFGKKKAAAAPPPAVAKQASFKGVAEKDLSVREEKEEEDFEEADNVWTTASWLRSQNLHKTIAAALKPDKPGMEQYDFMSKHLTDADLKKRLEAAGLSGLAAPLCAGLAELREQKASTGVALSNKFAADGDAYKGEMGFASIDVFFGGLEGLVGPPLMVEGSLMRQMEHEHTRMPDSDSPFSTSNGVSNASSQEEWEFVYCPVDGKIYVERTGLSSEHPEWRRKTHMKPLAFYVQSMDEMNARLRSKGHTEMGKEELVGGRLYTGAMYEKYNGVLRCFSSPLERAKQSAEPFLQARAVSLGLGKWFISPDTGRLAWQWHNKYTTTLHAINSAVLKLSKLSAVATVYRGFTGTVLPESFFHPNEDGVCGGVEYGFTSTSKVREHAQHYAAGKASTIFTNRMGMVDRGADFSWLSQYPHECEILFPPLVGLEVLKTNVQGDTLEVESRFSLNMSAQTLEQVVSKRRKMLLDMAHGMHFEVRNALVDLEGAKESGMMKKAWNEESADTRGAFAAALVKEGLAMAYPPEWFNDDAKFSEAVKWAMEAKKKLSKGDKSDELDLNHFGWLPMLPERLGDFPHVVTLNLKYCSELKSLPDRLGDLTKLTKLSLYGCKNMTKLPPSIKQCVLLEELDCQGCTNLTGLPDEMGASLSKLITLNLYGCKSIVTLPEGVLGTEWKALTTLNLAACIRLKALPKTLSGCTSLSDLSLANCAALCELPDLSALPNLNVASLPPRLQPWQAAGYTAYTYIQPARDRSKKDTNVIVSTFANLFSLSSDRKKEKQRLEENRETMTEEDIRDVMARRIQRAARGRLRWRLLSQLRRLKIIDDEEGTAASIAEAPGAVSNRAFAPSMAVVAQEKAAPIQLPERTVTAKPERGPGQYGRRGSTQSAAPDRANEMKAKLAARQEEYKRKKAERESGAAGSSGAGALGGGEGLEA